LLRGSQGCILRGLIIEWRWGALSEGFWAGLFIAVAVIGCVVAVLLGTAGAAIDGASSAAYPAAQPTTQTASEIQVEHPSRAEADGARVAKGEIWIGMTSEQALESWGPADEITRSSSAGGEYERWAYFDAGVYLYFQAGILTAIRD
jgi:hypothetical protein